MGETTEEPGHLLRDRALTGPSETIAVDSPGSEAVLEVEEDLGILGQNEPPGLVLLDHGAVDVVDEL